LVRPAPAFAQLNASGKLLPSPESAAHHRVSLNLRNPLATLALMIRFSSRVA
jgi:hypothetical protein